jgi:hypothetical protein
MVVGLDQVHRKISWGVDVALVIFEPDIQSWPW